MLVRIEFTIKNPSDRYMIASAIEAVLRLARVSDWKWAFNPRDW